MKHQSNNHQKRAASPIKPSPAITKPKTPPPLQKPKPAAATLPQPLVRTRRLSVFHPKFQKAYANRNNISPRTVTPSTPNQTIKCDVCHNLGTSNDVVRWVAFFLGPEKIRTFSGHFYFVLQMRWMQKEFPFSLSGSTRQKDTQEERLFMALC